MVFDSLAAVRWLTDPLSAPFMQRALLAALLLSITGGLLGTWIVLRRLAFFAHAAGSATFPGLVVAGPWGIAPPLAAAGVDLAWCERAAGLLDGAALGPGLEWVASTFAVASLLSEVKESTRRVSDLVAAVRSYSQMDRGSMQHIDVTDGLESTLLMLGHKLRDGVEVVRDYDADVPRVEVFAGELNQVWTNLIDNAVDAMDGAGTLRVATRTDGDAVVVEIGDTGPGMPTPVAARAFEAFYTTKDVGKGTGLGLDIARRIVVERHSGTISIDSRPGETVLRVGIPVRAHRPPGRATS